MLFDLIIRLELSRKFGDTCFVTSCSVKLRNLRSSSFSLCAAIQPKPILLQLSQSGHLLWKYQPSFIAWSPYIASLSLHAHWDCLRATYTSLRYLALPNTMSLLSKLHHHIKETDSYMGKDILMYCAARPPTLSLIVALCFPTLPAQDFLIILSTFLEESFNSDESNISTHSQT